MTVGNDDTHWRRWVVVFWVIGCVILVTTRWAAIQGFSFPDTDDNIRMSQVRALLAGQGWFDLRQYKLNPPTGFNIHWSRIVDLPISAIERVVRPWFGSFVAEKTAGALAPLLPLGVVLGAMAVTARRLVAPAAFAFAAALVFVTPDAMRMFMPLRVDHHGWQLAMLVLTIAGMADPRPVRGGIVMGLSSAMSLAIGLELMPFLVICGAAAVLRWVWQDEVEADRLRLYGVTLAGGCVLGYLGFASNDNATLRCDALSPVWLSTMVLAGALSLSLSYVRARQPLVRLALAGIGGVALAAAFALVWPQCLGRPEGVSPELYRIWLSNVREAKPLYVQSWSTAVQTAALPVIGIIGSLFALWSVRNTPRFAPWATVTLTSIVSTLLLFWQMRSAPAAQLMAIPGATALAWAILPRLAGHRRLRVRALGIPVIVLVITGGAAAIGTTLDTADKPTAFTKRVNRANFLCPSLAAMRPIARIPATTIFTFVDLGPRLITVTHHSAVAGPYHRNGDAILDVHHAFGGTPQAARAIMLRHGATLLLTCPNMSEATVHQARHKSGFYARLVKGERFDWLTPVPLPKDSPLKLWRIS